MTQWANNLKVEVVDFQIASRVSQWSTSAIGTFQPIAPVSNIAIEPISKITWSWSNANASAPQTLYSNSSSGMFWG